nr:MAG TPA: lysophospholipase L1-like protein [Caudoviricetes sp.]
MKPFKEVIDGIRKAVMASEVREDLAQMGEYVEQFANTATTKAEEAAASAKTAADAAGNASTAVSAAIDPTLSVSGKAADAAKVGEAVGQLKADITDLGIIIPIERSAKKNSITLSPNKTYERMFSYPFSKSKKYKIFASYKIEVYGTCQFTHGIFAKGTSQSDNYYVSLATGTKDYSDNSTVFVNYTNLIDYSNVVGVDIAFGLTNILKKDNFAVKNVEFCLIDVTDIENIDSYIDYIEFAVKNGSNIVKIASQPHLESKNIICWGDSLTEGVGGNGVSYPTVLQEKLGEHYNVINNGVGGENAFTICGRIGAIPALVEPFTIKANSNEPIEITLKSTGGLSTFNLLGVKGVNPVKIGNIDGSIQIADNKIMFSVKDVALADRTVKRPSILRTQFFNSKRNDIVIVFMGQNGWWGYYDNQKLVNEYLQIVNFLNTDKYLFIGLTTGTKEERESLEQLMGNTFGGHYINMRDYLVSYGLSDNSLTPTKEDSEAIKNGKVPPQLLSDSVHGNSYFYKSMAIEIYNRGLCMGYWNNVN